ncbi:MAG: phosphatidate cytidylyltransferase [bacterium]|nr:phosphatidate cytidylyltransferase [bacterium]
MFMQRLITSLILIPLVLLILFYAPIWFLAGLVVLVILASTRECWQLIPIKSKPLQIIFSFLVLFSLWGCGELFSYWQLLGLGVWVLIFIAILTFPNSQRYWGYSVLVATVCCIVLPLFAQSLIHLYFITQGKSLLLYLLFIVWASDIGAYIAGKRFGSHKLIPRVSPGKSWEGALGGFILAMMIAISGYFYFHPHSSLNWFVLAGCTVVISIFGDLFISILKRRSNIKDTGSLIPGHGGVLDRLDSLIAALPWFYFGLTYIPLGF